VFSDIRVNSNNSDPKTMPGSQELSDIRQLLLAGHAPICFVRQDAESESAEIFDSHGGSGLHSQE
jgi:hypothetical protein